MRGMWYQCGCCLSVQSRYFPLPVEGDVGTEIVYFAVEWSGVAVDEKVPSNNLTRKPQVRGAKNGRGVQLEVDTTQDNEILCHPVMTLNVQLFIKR